MNVSIDSEILFAFFELESKRCIRFQSMHFGITVFCFFLTFAHVSVVNRSTLTLNVNYALLSRDVATNAREQCAHCASNAPFCSFNYIFN